MNPLLIVSISIAVVGALILIAMSAYIMTTFQKKPYVAEKAPAKGSPGKGVLYAFTMGMAPWAKESARRHPVAYLRGIVFHLGIFASALFLITTPWLTEFPSPLRVFLVAFFSLAAVMTLTGIGMRLANSALRMLSTPDDYFSLGLVTVLLSSGAVAAAQTNLLPFFLLMSGLTMAYMPFGKLRHFLYFFYERIFFGLVNGRRGVIGWKHE
jgi:nitrate reductase gamma subunit